jgi:hypothetical protein
VVVELEMHARIRDHAVRAVTHAPLDHFVVDAEIHQPEGDGLGALGEQVQLDVVVFGGGAREHRAHERGSKSDSICMADSAR